MSRKHFLGTILFLLTAWVVQAQETERQYLSGTGLGNTVTWQFPMYPKDTTAGAGVKSKFLHNGNCKGSVNIPMAVGIRNPE